VFQDLDHDGLQDLDEPYLQGVRVFADIDGNGAFDQGEPIGESYTSGYFNLYGLPDGDYDIRLDMPAGYKHTTGPDVVPVTVRSDLGVRGMSFGLDHTGTDLAVAFNYSRMANTYQTGTRVKVPLILGNIGDEPMPAGDVRLRLWMSGDGGFDKAEDTRLVTVSFDEPIKAGEAYKVEVEFYLPDALADFASYLIADVVGKTVRGDFHPDNNRVVSSGRLTFKASGRDAAIDEGEQDIILGNWSSVAPYGGHEPGEGYVGIIDLNTELSNWNAGYPTGSGGGTIIINNGGTIDPGGTLVIGDPPPPPTNMPGQPASISGKVTYNFPESELADYIGYAVGPAWVGATVYLDQNRNGVLDDSEASVVTDAEGRYTFTDLPTYTNDSPDEMTYWVRVDDVPDTWVDVNGSNSYGMPLRDGRNIEYADISFYAKPRIDALVLDTPGLEPGQVTTLTAEGVADPDGEIKAVYFYYQSPSESGGVVSDLIGVDTDGADGYSMQTDSLFSRRATGDAAVFAVAVDDGGFLTGVRTDTTYTHAVTVSAGKPVVLRDVNGKRVSFKLYGRGSVEVSLGGAVNSIEDLGDRLEVGGPATITELHYTGTNARSRLVIGTPDGRVRVTGKVTGSSYLGVLDAPSANFIQGIELTGNGVIRTIKAHRVRGITMPGTQINKGVTIVANKVQGSVTLGSTLRRLKTETLSSAYITTPSAETIQVEKDFRNGVLNLTDPDAEFGLGLLSVGNRMASVHVHSYAAIDTIRAHTMTGSNLSAGRLVLISELPDPMFAFQQRVRINQVHITGGAFNTSSIAAWRVRSIVVDADRQSALSDSATEVLARHLNRYQGPAHLLKRSNNTVLRSLPFRPLSADPVIPG